MPRDKEVCQHVADANEDVAPKADGCQECQEMGRNDWVALRLCLACGHVGCCDSSPGMHATDHFNKTGHPVIMAHPDKKWKWCYMHKVYD